MTDADERQPDLFSAPNEESRPKEEIPVRATAKERAAAPPTPPKKRKAVKGHNDDSPYLQPRGCGGRVMLLDSIVLAVRFEDPFHDKGQYPIEMSFDEFAAGEWSNADPNYVASEYERLAILPPHGSLGKNIVENVTQRCEPKFLLEHYRGLLRDALLRVNRAITDLPKAKFNYKTYLQ